MNEQLFLKWAEACKGRQPQGSLAQAYRYLTWRQNQNLIQGENHMLGSRTLESNPTNRHWTVQPDERSEAISLMAKLPPVGRKRGRGWSTASTLACNVDRATSRLNSWTISSICSNVPSTSFVKCSTKPPSTLTLISTFMTASLHGVNI
jgi:hypothetical protein